MLSRVQATLRLLHSLTHLLNAWALLKTARQLRDLFLEAWHHWLAPLRAGRSQSICAPCSLLPAVTSRLANQSQAGPAAVCNLLLLLLLLYTAWLL